MEKTLREVCIALNVSRRAVQGYENAGLVSASGRNSREYLLYDDEAQERIQRIKMYQDLGFSLKEIKEIIDAPKEMVKSALQKQQKKLKEEREYQGMLMQKALELIERR